MQYPPRGMNPGAQTQPYPTLIHGQSQNATSGSSGRTQALARRE
jgi:hypothetical protein